MKYFIALTAILVERTENIHHSRDTEESPMSGASIVDNSELDIPNLDWKACNYSSEEK